MSVNFPRKTSIKSFFHYTAYTILTLITVFSLVQLLQFAQAAVNTNPVNPGHPWTEIGYGNFDITNNQTALRTYTFPDTDAVILTDQNQSAINYNSISNIPITASGDQFVFSTSFNHWQIAGVNYVMPASQGGVDKVLKNDGNGNLTWGNDAVGNAFTFSGNNIYTTGTNSGGSMLAWASSNFFAGFNAGALTTSGSNNLVIGNNALSLNTIGSSNMAIGANALSSNTTGSTNTAIGLNALSSNGIGSYNTAIGESSLVLNSIGNSNVAIGPYTLSLNTTGGGNIAIGDSALSLNTTGNNNIGIGTNADVTSNNFSNATAIGYNAKVGASNSLVLGGTGADKVKVGIGTTTPGNVLDVVGAIADTTVMSISTLGGNTCTFNTGVNPGVWSCVSDERLKNSIVSIGNDETALSRINELNPVMFHYNWQAPSDPLVPGFIAQEFEKTFPNMVITDKDGYKSLSYTPLIPYTIKAIQELDLKIEELAIKTTGENLDKNSNGFFDRLANYFSDTANGIKEFVSGILRAKDKLCIGEGVDEVCITKEELLQMKNSSANINNITTPEVIPENIPAPAPETVTVPETITTPETTI